MHNLRPDYTSLRLDLRPSPMPQHPCAEQGWRAVATIAYDKTLFRRADRVGLLRDGLPYATAALPEGTRSLHSAGAAVVAMTDHGAYTITHDAESQLLLVTSAGGAMPEPLFHLQAAPAATARLTATHLSRPYENAETLHATDASRIASVCRSAYESLVRNAAGMGAYIAPVLARVRYIHTNGAVVAETSPILLGHPEGAQAPTTVYFDSHDHQNTLDATLEAPAWRGTVNFPADDSMRHIAAAEIILSPQFHIVDTAGAHTVAPARAAGTERMLSCMYAPTLLGRGDDLALSIRRIAAFPDTWDERVALRIPYPFAREATYDIPAKYLRPSYDDVIMLEKALRHTPGPVDTTAAWLRPPHTFTAGAGTHGTTTMLWGDLSMIRFSGYGPRHFAITSTDEPWEGYTRTTMADGTSVASIHSGTSGAPALLQPILSYPAPDARRIEIGLRIGSRCFRGTYDLAPDEAGTGASAIVAGGLPFSLPPAPDYTPPPATADTPPGPIPGYHASARSHQPSRLIGAYRSGIAPPRALIRARYGQSSWDFGRERYYAFTSAGIHTIALNASLTAISVNSIDPRALASPSALAETPQGIMAIAGGDLIRLSGTAARTIACRPDTRALAWDPDRHELWCVNTGPCDDAPSGNVTVLCAQHSWTPYTLGITLHPDGCTPEAPGWLADAHGAALPAAGLPSDGQLTSIAIERTIDSTEARAPALGRQGPRLQLPIAGTVSALDIDVARGYLGRYTDASVTHIHLTGTIRAPLTMPLLILPAPSLRITLTGAVHPDFIIAPHRLLIKQPK